MSDTTRIEKSSVEMVRRCWLLDFPISLKAPLLDLVRFVPVKQERQELCNVEVYDIMTEKCFLYDYMENVGKENVCLKE